MNPDDAPVARGDFMVGEVGKCGAVGEAGAVCGRGRFKRAVDLEAGTGTGTASKEGRA